MVSFGQGDTLKKAQVKLIFATSMTDSSSIGELMFSFLGQIKLQIFFIFFCPVFTIIFFQAPEYNIKDKTWVQVSLGYSMPSEQHKAFKLSVVLN